MNFGFFSSLYLVSWISSKLDTKMKSLAKEVDNSRFSVTKMNCDDKQPEKEKCPMQLKGHLHERSWQLLPIWHILQQDWNQCKSLVPRYKAEKKKAFAIDTKPSGSDKNDGIRMVKLCLDPVLLKLSLKRCWVTTESHSVSMWGTKDHQAHWTILIIITWVAP